MQKNEGRFSSAATEGGSSALTSEVSPATAYGVGAVACGVFISLWFVPYDQLLKSIFALCFVAMFGLRSWTVALMLLLIQIQMFALERGSADAYGMSNGHPLLSVAVVALLIFSSRYLALTSPPIPYRLGMRESIRLAGLHLRRAKRDLFAPFGMRSRNTETVDSSEVITGLVRIFFPVVVVSFLLAAIPLDPYTPDYARLIPPAVRAITLGIILLLIFVVVNGVVKVVSWRRRSGLELKVFLRSELSQWIHREVSAVAKRQMKLRIRRRS